MLELRGTSASAELTLPGGNRASEGEEAGANSPLEGVGRAGMNSPEERVLKGALLLNSSGSRVAAPGTENSRWLLRKETASSWSWWAAVALYGSKWLEARRVTW